MHACSRAARHSGADGALELRTGGDAGAAAGEAGAGKKRKDKERDEKKDKKERKKVRFVFRVKKRGCVGPG